MRIPLSLPIALVAVLHAGAAGVSAQTLTLRIENGLVTLDARNVPVRQILDRWADVGRVTIVNGDRLSFEPVTLALAGVPEREALQVLLRQTSGYILGAREARAAGETVIDRVLILPSSRAPQATPAGVAASRPPLFVPQDDPVFVDDPGVGGVPPETTVHETSAGESVGVTPSFGAPVNAARPPAPQRPPDSPVRYLDEVDANGNRVRAPTIPDDAIPEAESVPENVFGIRRGTAKPGPPPPAPPSREP